MRASTSTGRSSSSSSLYVLIAALLAFIGLSQVKQVKAPERAIEQGKQIPSALKGQADAASPPAAALNSGE